MIERLKAPVDRKQQRRLEAEARNRLSARAAADREAPAGSWRPKLHGWARNETGLKRCLLTPNLYDDQSREKLKTLAAWSRHV